MVTMPLNANEYNYLFIDEVDSKIGRIDMTTENSFDQQPDRG